uniref:Large ribosomal subunit protein bL32m n=1 Tax=Leersia perrieri TaxID=77586 RepID=A0A0D9XJJ5_9ORYZ
MAAAAAAAGGWLRRAASAAGTGAFPRIPCGLPILPIPPPAAVVPEFPALALPSQGAAMELMAVPKKKVSKYKKGLRNGPKALKPVPVIVRCKCCGRVKLPHFYCCSGERGNPGSESS